MSKDQITQIKDDILDLVNTIGDSPAMQEAINELMALDESSIPVGAYKQKFNKIWEEIFPDENTQELKDANPLYKQLVPDQERIQTMIDAVKQELEVGSKHLVEGLSLEDLEVAYKIRGEYDNDYDEAKKAYEDIVAKRQEAAKSLSDEERYWGNVDQYARNIVLVTDELVEKLKSKELIPEKWTKDDVGTYMTTFGMDDKISSGALSGQHIMYTPILPDGQLLDRNTINEYINKIAKDASSEADVLAMDKKGLKIGETFVQGIVNGITNVDDELINSALDPIFASIDESKITKYGDDVNKIVTDNLANAFDITDKETISVLSDSVSGILKDAVENAGADANIKDIIDAQAYELAMAAATSKSYDQHLLQAKIYDEEYAALIRLNNATFTFAELQEKIAANSNKITGPIVETYSTLAATTASLHEVELQTSEIILNNTKVTQEYKDSLIELGVSQEELDECFDSTNKLVVTNAKGLNKLIKNTKSNTAQNVKLAKSQAQLQYYELYKKMGNYVSAEGEVIQSKIQDIVALYEEMNALEKTIAQYSRLEVELLGAANAYKKFAQAQEMDTQSDYITSAEEMVVALGEAFETGELGTETAQTAIAGLVPPSVYEDLDTVDKKMAAIHKYFKEGKLAQYFDIQFDEDGVIESAEMKLGNFRKFIEDGLNGDNNKDGINVFKGANWKEIEFSDEFLAGLDKAPDKLQYFADQMKVTKEVAFAFIESINDHDIEWLGGDYSSMFDIFTQSLEGSIHKTTQSMADLTVQLATGEIKAEDYSKAMYGLEWQVKQGEMSAEEFKQKEVELKKQLDENKITADYYTQTLYGLAGLEEKNAKKAEENATAWLEKSKALEEAQEKLDKYYKMLETGKDENGNVINAEEVKKQVGDTLDEIDKLTGELKLLEEPTQLTIQVAIDKIQDKIDALKKDLEKEKINLQEAVKIDAEGTYYVTTEFQDNEKLQQYVNYLNTQHELEVLLGPEAPNVLSTLQDVNETLTNIQNLLAKEFKLKVEADGAITKATTLKDTLAKLSDKTVTVTTWIKEFVTRTPKESDVNGTANVKGTAYKGGSWGAPRTETALTGELGPEILVRGNRWTTIGEHGAEFTEVKKGDIIFNHKQSEQLLKNGHITGRGKAYASGTAYEPGSATFYPYGSSKKQWEGTGYDGPNDSTYNLNDALSNIKNASKDAKDAADEFADTIDWVEIRLEEINEQLDLMSAKLENASDYASKNNIIDQMIGVNENKISNLTAGIKKYSEYAARLLVDVPAKYREAAQNGAISISEFAGEADEKTVEAINNYREWAQKVADLNQQLEETKTELRDLAIQKIDNAEYYGAIRAEFEDNQTEKLQNAVDYDTERGMIADPRYYSVMMKHATDKIGHLIQSRDKMQKDFDDAVKTGVLTPWTDQWYEQVNRLYEVDSEISAATIELEEFQNAINDIYWESFDELIDQYDYISDETQGLIDLMSSEDLYTKPDFEEGWGSDDVKWTKEGIATLGLHAQEMERAEAKAKDYARAIDDLTAEYEAGHYSESEYNEKLNELTQGQYEAIEAAKKEKEAIVELQEARIDEVKKGIELQIESYEKLIDAKKEELDAEKD